jgi:hypothetical protein
MMRKVPLHPWDQSAHSPSDENGRVDGDDGDGEPAGVRGVQPGLGAVHMEGAEDGLEGFGEEGGVRGKRVDGLLKVLEDVTAVQ